MITFSKIKTILDSMDLHRIESLTIRTGAGLIIDMSDRVHDQDTHFIKPHMGLEAHTKAQTEDAMQKSHIITEDSITQHKHDTGGIMGGINELEAHPGTKWNATYHDTYYKHYGWQMQTIAPLLIVIKKSPSYKIVNFCQALPAPTNQIQDMTTPKDFSIELKNNVAILYYHLIPTLFNPEDSMIEIYQSIFKVCERTNYLFCNTITTHEAIEFKADRMEKQ